MSPQEAPGAMSNFQDLCWSSSPQGVLRTVRVRYGVPLIKRPSPIRFVHPRLIHRRATSTVNMHLSLLHLLNWAQALFRHPSCSQPEGPNIVLIGDSQNYSLSIPSNGIWFHLGGVGCVRSSDFSCDYCNQTVVSDVMILVEDRNCTFVGYGSWNHHTCATIVQKRYSIGPPQNVEWARCESTVDNVTEPLSQYALTDQVGSAGFMAEWES
jgi:hypothetical protein